MMINNRAWMGAHINPKSKQFGDVTRLAAAIDNAGSQQQWEY